MATSHSKEVANSIVPAPTSGAALFTKMPRNESIRIRSTSEGDIDVETMHISCQSDMYQRGHNYAGVITYQYDGKSDWTTANGTRCKSGYIVIQDTDSENVKKWTGKEPGAVHGAVYRNAFGESVSKGNVVGEGFAYRNENVKLKSLKLTQAFSTIQRAAYTTITADKCTSSQSIALERSWSTGKPPVLTGPNKEIFK